MFSIRDARIEDAPVILNFIRELAEYEKLSDKFATTEDIVRRDLFGDHPKAFCMIAEIEQEPAGFAICFYTYSTFRGNCGIHIEDLYVREPYRGKGIGKGFFQALAQKAQHENCGRIQWLVLDWNESSIQFYKSMQAEALEGWTFYRLEGDALVALAA